MDKPNDHSTLSYMRTYIRNKKLNEKPIKLNMKRAETIKHLRKLGHWDSSVDGKKKPKAGIAVKGTSKKRVTIGKEEVAKKRLDEYVKLHTLYINTFDDKGLKKYSTFKSAKSDSDKLLNRMADLVEPIAQSLILDYIKKTKGVTKARAQVKSLSNSLEERFDKLPKKKKPEKKQKVLAIEDKPKTKAPTKRKSKSQPPTGPLIAKADRDAYVASFYSKYKQTKSVFEVLKPFDKRLGGKLSAMLVPLDELKQIRRKTIVKLHPDKGGDADKFDMVNDAFNALISSYKVPGYKSFSTLINEKRADEAQKK